MFSREGFTVDWLASTVNKSLLNPTLLLPLLATLSAVDQRTLLAKYLSPELLSRLCQALRHLPPGALVRARSAGLTCLAVGLAIRANDFLNKQFENNWTRPSHWDWKREIVLITGGSSGIGARVAQMMLARTPETTIVIVDYSPLLWTPPQGSRVHYYQADLSKSQVIKEVSAKIREEVGHPTVLVNNAGLCRGFTMLEGKFEDTEVTVRTNVTAPMLLIKEFLPHMVERNHGHIVNLCSMGAFISPPEIVDYCATKAGIFAMHEGLQVELNDYYKAPKVRLTLAMPNFVRTPLLTGTFAQPNFLFPFLHVDSVSEEIVDALYSGYGKRFILPGIMNFVVALKKAGPWWVGRLISEAAKKTGVDFKGRQKVDTTGGLTC